MKASTGLTGSVPETDSDGRAPDLGMLGRTTGRKAQCDRMSRSTSTAAAAGGGGWETSTAAPEANGRAAAMVMARIINGSCQEPIAARHPAICSFRVIEELRRY